MLQLFRAGISFVSAKRKGAIARKAKALESSSLRHATLNKKKTLKEYLNRPKKVSKSSLLGKIGKKWVTPQRGTSKSLVLPATGTLLQRLESIEPHYAWFTPSVEGCGRIRNDTFFSRQNWTNLYSERKKGVNYSPIKMKYFSLFCQFIGL